MKTKTIVILIAGIFLFSFESHAQNRITGKVTDEETNDDYFILGTFSDYLGREYIDANTCEIDYYSLYEKELGNYIYALILQRYGEDDTRLQKKGNRYYLYSCPQFKEIDSLYRHSHGLLTKNIFSTDEQALSYMHGVYTRFGNIENDTTYHILVYNSNHGRFFDDIARHYGFTNIKRVERNTIPHATHVYFTPTEQFLKMIRPTEELKAILLQAKEEKLKKLFGKKLYKELKKIT
jgi:hypothetical protein